MHFPPTPVYPSRQSHIPLEHMANLSSEQTLPEMSHFPPSAPPGYETRRFCASLSSLLMLIVNNHKSMLNERCVGRMVRCDRASMLCVCGNGCEPWNGSCSKTNKSLHCMFILEGKPWGPCTANDTCDKNVECLEGMCMCKDGFDGQCIMIGAFGGQCDGTGNNECSKDKNAVCDTTAEKCMCNAQSDPIQGMCRMRGAVGGMCDGSNECTQDVNAQCMDGMCTCKTGFSPFSGMCRRDGAEGGFCVENTCTMDKNAGCVSGMCMCKAGYRAIGGMCRRDGSFGGMCVGNACPNDKHAMCMNGMCVCSSTATAIAGWCVPNGAPGGHCELGACPLDKLATCTNNMCMCRTGSVAIGGSCRPTGSLGGMCSSTSKCKGKFLTCDTSSMMCVCRGGCRTFHGTPKATQVARYIKSGWFSNNMQTIQFQQTNIVPTK
ncbi:TEN3-like protein [Mya arenaria]|uniref:TEN3-like protein n=1 Tax=Mya arenaria TaxID=6604 RepID=A0ABY7DTT5_MYAAR|nr:TEN3-like protein [Mya arenaria]